MGKRIVIYCLLSLILVIPVTAMIVLSILAQPDHTYTAYLSDEAAPVTEEIREETIREVISCTGVFDTDDVTTLTFPATEEALPVVLSGEGALIRKGDVLCRIGSQPYRAETDGLITEIRESGDAVMLKLKQQTPDQIRVSLPVTCYPYADASECNLEYADKSYSCQLIRVERAAGEDNLFSACYRLPDGPFLLNASVPVQVSTGHVKEKVLTVPADCIRKDEADGALSVEVFHAGDVEKVPVETGITDGNRVEIRSTEENSWLKAGMQVVKGDKTLSSESEQQSESVQNGGGGETE